MARFLFWGFAIFVLAGCEAPIDDRKPMQPQAVQREPTEGEPILEAMPEGVVEVELMPGMKMPVPSPEYQSNGVDDELEHLILSDFKKDFDLYKIYEFPPKSGKPQLMYVFTKDMDEDRVVGQEVGLAILQSGPVIYGYEDFAKKMKGANKIVQRTSPTGWFQWGGNKMSFYGGDISADYSLNWLWITKEGKGSGGQVIYLRRSKGQFKDEVWSDGYETWWNNTLLMIKRQRMDEGK